VSCWLCTRIAHQGSHFLQCQTLGHAQHPLADGLFRCTSSPGQSAFQPSGYVCYDGFAQFKAASWTVTSQMFRGAPNCSDCFAVACNVEQAQHTSQQHDKGRWHRWLTCVLTNQIRQEANDLHHERGFVTI